MGLATTKLFECQTLFESIITTAKSDNEAALSQIEDQADMGKDLSGEWAEFFDGQRDDLQKKECSEFTELLQLQKAAKGVSRKEAAELNPLIDDTASYATFGVLGYIVALFQELHVAEVDLAGSK